MNDRRMKMVAGLIKHLEDMDGDELSQSLKPSVAQDIQSDPKGPEDMKDGVMPGANYGDGHKGPMEILAEKGSDPKSLSADKKDEDEVDDDEFEELMKMHS